MKKQIKKTITIFSAVIMLLFSTLIFPINLTVQASNKSNNFDKMNVMDDLNSSTVNGRDFDIRDYPYRENANIEIINVVEYCYSFKSNMQSNFALYVYLYNPSGIAIDEKSVQNKIQLAVGYNAENTPTSYEKFDIKFINKSEQSDYKNLFYKYKIVDKKSNFDNKSILERVSKDSNERRYDISGIELLTLGGINAKEYTVGGTYLFKGYAKGYGADPDAPSSLTSNVNDLETIALEIKNTNFRTGVSSLGKGHQNELNSVYFSVDNDVLEKYGSLQKIKAEWYEYKTAPIIVTKDTAMYNAMLSYVGQKITTPDLITSNIPYGFMYNPRKLGDKTIYSWAYNGYYDYPDLIIPLPPTAYEADKKASAFYLLFPTDKNDSTISSDELKNYIYTYNKSFHKGTVPTKTKPISLDLFADTVDAGRKQGHNIALIDSDNKFNMLSYNSNHSWWDKLKDFGFSRKPDLGDDYIDIAPIHSITENELLGSDAVISKKLLVDELDITDLKKFYTAETKLNKTTFLFRFSQTDYFSGNIRVRNHSTGKDVQNNTYLAQETVFLDFDILELTFNKAGVYKVIPVVSSPIDIINAVTPPLVPDKINWWLIGFIILAIILILIFLPQLIVLFIKGIVFLITLPFKLIARLIKGPKNKKRKRK